MNSAHPPPALSIVVPLYRSAATVPRLVAELSALEAPGGLELVLVDDGSGDGTAEAARRAAAMASVPVTVIELSRNYGEHAAVLEGLRRAAGRHVVTMDDDLQNPPAEALRLWRHAVAEGVDVVYGVPQARAHALWRNLGSRLANRTADLVLDKPAGLTLSSFRCLSAFVCGEIASRTAPFVYIDGLLLQVTASVSEVTVAHDPRREGGSGYDLRRLVRLWLNLAVNFSVAPLRLATLLGFLLAGAGFMFTCWVLIEHFLRDQPVGWSSLMATLLVFCGTQLLLLGVAGEYLGRVYLTLNGKPQRGVRSAERFSGMAPGGRDRADGG